MESPYSIVNPHQFIYPPVKKISFSARIEKAPCDRVRSHMKYMGSKRSMLQNGLGEALESASFGTDRFVDLFTGSASVAWYAAEKMKRPVLASDLQLFATCLAAAILTRRKKSNVDEWWPKWQ